MRNIIHILIATVLVAFISSCEKQDVRSIRLAKPAEPAFKSELPAFPAASVHILQREYEHVKRDGFKKSGTVLTIEEYIEQRLIELYPETAYEGMLEQAQKEMEYYKAEYEIYLAELQAYNEANGIGTIHDNAEEYKEFTTLEAEIEYMGLTPEEIEEFIKYEALASSDVPVSRELLDSLTNLQGNNKSLKSGVITGVIISAGVISGYSAWRIWQSAERANEKADDFYSGLTNSGQKGDAFRHIYVSMLLRRYITQVGAWAVMGMYETLKPNDHARDTYMDYHNNKVGRDTQYSTFRGSWLNDMYDWETWATNAKNWVNNSGNAINMQDLYDWYTDDPDKSTAKEDESKVSDYKYIYYR